MSTPEHVLTGIDGLAFGNSTSGFRKGDSRAAFG